MTLPLLDDPPVETILMPAFLCYVDPACKGKRATAGPWSGDDECRNREIRCLDCGRAGRESENLTPKAQRRGE